MLALAAATQLLLVLTPLAEVFYNRLDVTAPPQHADVIVCLGGSDMRIIAAAQAYRAGWAPKVAVTNKPDAVGRMSDLLTLCGVPEADILVDNRSYVTADHPAGVAAIPGIDPASTPILIITDDTHSRRAGACFRRGGYAQFSITSPRYLNGQETAERGFRWRVLTLPYLAYEYTALLKYWLAGRL